MLPGEADAAVELDRLLRNRAIGIGGQQLGLGGDALPPLSPVDECTAGIAGESARDFKRNLQIGGAVFERLERTDGAIELVTRTHIGNRLLQRPLGAADRKSTRLNS